VLAPPVALDLPALPLAVGNGAGRAAVSALWVPRGFVSMSPGAVSRGARVGRDRGLHSPLPNDQRTAEARRRANVGGSLELVDEIAEEEIDLDALHDALAAVLVSYHRRTTGEPRGAAG
jgi:hypothetical protein